jgi:hypothetical protein
MLLLLYVSALEGDVTIALFLNLVQLYRRLQADLQQRHESHSWNNHQVTAFTSCDNVVAAGLAATRECNAREHLSRRVSSSGEFQDEW